MAKLLLISPRTLDHCKWGNSNAGSLAGIDPTTLTPSRSSPPIQTTAAMARTASNKSGS